ncbi:hypothetical protein [Paraliomyxa miuraensis]|uniref:hypothetical protein n=1 Tax=Paraliomyxa miuraensis TaxID=376150 RepID=UPI00225ABF51|nr:hypothetical protein [Paraliomyxa miuraensis]MCX4246104.1 hypothetical protein [Paraliomyxa miuraensis]
MPVSIPGLPAESQELFERLHDAPLESADVLRKELREYVARSGWATRDNELLDVTQVEALARGCEELLTLAEGADEATQRLVGAAVRYFVAEADVEPDRESLWGLDDDAAVCRAVARHLGRGDLFEGA